jgi:beta-lactamase regulating signal transducer with metallopeptidase domain/N-acetylglutamate synthase-like GNAT family acetyltransferase
MIHLSSQSIALIQLLLDAFVKSAVILASAGLLTAALSKSSASARHLVWSVGIISLLALPVFSVALPSWRVPAIPSLATTIFVEESVREASYGKGGGATELEYKREVVIPALSAGRTFNVPSVESPAPDAEAKSVAPSPMAPTSVGAAQPTSRRNRFDWKLALITVWAAGALLVMARLAAGMASVWSLTRRAQRITDGSWLALAGALGDGLGLRGSVRIFKAEEVSLPMTWGLLRSVVLLPKEAEEWPEERRRIVLLHELTHIKRRDCLMQALAQLSCALYWFNPLIWTAAWRMRVEREVACDDHVLEFGAKASDYASHLVEIASSFKAANYGSLAPLGPVAVGMACSHLESRVRSILNPNARRRGVNGLKVALAAVIAAVLTASLAMLRPWRGAEASARDGRASNTSLTQTLSVSPDLLSSISEAQNQADGSASQTNVQTPEPTPNQELAQAEDRARQDSNGVGQSQGQGEGQGAGQSAGQGQGKSGDLTVDQLIQMRSVGVTPEYIEAIRKLGYSDLTVKQAIDLRSVGVSEEFIQQARAWTNGNVSINELVELKAIGMSPDFIAGMKQAGYDNLPIKKLVEMRAVGVKPEFVATMRRLGYDNLTADQLVNLRAVGVNEAFVTESQNWGYGKLSVDQLIEMKAVGVSAEFARSMKALGLENLSLKDLIEMRSVGVSEDYVKQMRELGFDKLNAHQLIETKAVGVTPDYVRKMRAIGLKNVSIHELIEFKATGVDKILTKEKK